MANISGFPGNSPNNVIAALVEISTEDYEEHDPLPGQGTGREGLTQRVTMLRTGVAPTFSLEDIIAERDRVVVRWKSTGTHMAEFLGVPPTGKTYTIPGIDIHRIRDGKLAEHWHVIDLPSMMQQLGLMPAQES